MYLSIYLSIYLFSSLAIYLSIYPPFIYPCIYFSIYLPTYLTIYLSIYLSNHLIYLPMTAAPLARTGLTKAFQLRELRLKQITASEAIKECTLLELS